MGQKQSSAPTGAGRDRRAKPAKSAKPTRQANTAVGYCRRSTDKQEQSIADQRRAIERHCADEGLTLVDWYIDDAISGTRATNRPAFQAMLAAAQSAARPFAYIVVYDVKRFGRLDNDEAGHYRHLLRQAGVEVVYVSEGFARLGESSDTDDLLRPVKQWQARQESKDLSKVTIRGLLTKVEGGWWMGGVPPHGYDLRYESDRGEFLFVVRYEPDGTKRILDQRGRTTRTLQRGEALSISKRDRARLVPGAPDRVKVIERLFAMYVEERRGLRAITDAFNREKVPTPRGPQWAEIYSGVWRDSVVRSILTNPIYRGDMVWNRRADGRFHSIVDGRAVERRQVHGARLVPNDEADWIVIAGAHQALVPKRTWALAQAIREGKPASRSQRGVSPRDEPARAVGGWTGMRARFLLSGLVRCARCGGRYQGVTRRKGRPKKDGTIVKTRSYACGAYVSKGRSVCAFGPVNQEMLEARVVEATLAFYAERYRGADGPERLAAAVRGTMGVEAGELASARERVEAELAQVDGTIAALLDNLTASTRDLVERRLGQLREQRNALEARAAELERLSMGEREVREATHDVAAFLAALETTLRSDVNERRRAALRRCVERIVVDSEAKRATLRLHEIPLALAGGERPAAEMVVELG